MAIAATSKKPPKSWGAEYGGPVTTRDGRSLAFRRRCMRVRFYDGDVQVGPEQPSVAAAVAYALNQGWRL